MPIWEGTHCPAARECSPSRDARVGFSNSVNRSHSANSTLLFGLVTQLISSCFIYIFICQHPSKTMADKNWDCYIKNLTENLAEALETGSEDVVTTLKNAVVSAQFLISKAVQ